MNSVENKIQSIVTEGKKIVILDTDFGGDQDDLSAVAAMIWAERTGFVNIYGICESVPREGIKDSVKYNGISAIDAMCNYYGISDMMFGVDFLHSTQESAYCKTAQNSYEHTMMSNVYAYDAVEFYRRALSSLPDGIRCDVAITGYLTAFSRFLDSPADSISSLTGKQLAEAKIDKLWIVGGGYPQGRIETNFAGNPNVGVPLYVNATNNVLNNFTRDIIFWGIGSGDAYWAGRLYDDNATWNFLYNCLNEYCEAAWPSSGAASKEDFWKTLSCPDGVLTLAMCEGVDKSGFSLARGTNSINTDQSSPDYGKNSFTLSNNGNHYYCYAQTGRETAWRKNHIESIVAEQAWPSISAKVRLKRPSRAAVTSVVEYTPTSSSSNVPMRFEKYHTYRMSLPDFPSSDINFYKSDNKTGVNLLAKFSSTVKEVVITSYETLESLPTTCYAELKTYNITVVDEYNVAPLESEN